MNIDRLFDGLSLAAWSIFAIVVFGSFVANWGRFGLAGAFWRLLSLRTLLATIPPLIITLIAASLVFIEPQQVGVVVSFLEPRGYREFPLESGRHWIVPISEQVVVYPISRQTYTMSSNPLDGDMIGNDAIRARTSDGQEVSIDVSVIFAIDPEEIIQLHITWQDRYVNDLIRPLIRGFVRTQVAAFTVSEVNSSKRQELESTLAEALDAELDTQGLVLDQFLLRNVTFTDEYAASVEQKQVALERATQSGYEAERIRTLAEGRADEVRRLAEARAEAVIIEAQAQSEALNLIREALAGDENLLLYRYIDKIAPNVRVMLLPSGNPFILSLSDLNQMPEMQESLPAQGNNAANATQAPAVPTATPTPSSSGGGIFPDVGRMTDDFALNTATPTFTPSPIPSFP